MNLPVDITLSGGFFEVARAIISRRISHVQLNMPDDPPTDGNPFKAVDYNQTVDIITDIVCEIRKSKMLETRWLRDEEYPVPPATEAYLIGLPFFTEYLVEDTKDISHSSYVHAILAGLHLPILIRTLNQVKTDVTFTPISSCEDIDRKVKSYLIAQRYMYERGHVVTDDNPYVAHYNGEKGSSLDTILNCYISSTSVCSVRKPNPILSVQSSNEWFAHTRKREATSMTASFNAVAGITPSIRTAIIDEHNDDHMKRLASQFLLFSRLTHK